MPKTRGESIFFTSITAWMMVYVMTLYNTVLATGTFTNLTFFIALKNMSQARAALRGREFVTPDDVKTVAPYVCVHRLICRSTVMRDPDSAKREILDKMIKELPVPTEQI